MSSPGADLDSADDAQLLQAAGAADRGEQLERPPPAPGSIEVQLQPGQDPGAAIEDGLWVAAVVQWGGVVREVLPAKCAARLDEQRLLKIGAAFAKVARHYNWKFAGIVAHPLAGLAAECFPVAEPVVMPYVLSLVTKKPAPAAPGDPAPAAPPAADASSSKQDTAPTR